MTPLCQSCNGACCRNVRLPVGPLDPEQTRAAETRGVVVDGVWFIDSVCKHLTGGGRCSIYETRPDACRAYGVGGEACLQTREVFGC